MSRHAPGSLSVTASNGSDLTLKQEALPVTISGIPRFVFHPSNDSSLLTSTCNGLDSFNVTVIVETDFLGTDSDQHVSTIVLSFNCDAFVCAAGFEMTATPTGPVCCCACEFRSVPWSEQCVVWVRFVCNVVTVPTIWTSTPPANRVLRGPCVSAALI
jgi:hypothetical protein